jgi:hypothetical protein
MTLELHAITFSVAFAKVHLTMMIALRNGIMVSEDVLARNILDFKTNTILQELPTKYITRNIWKNKVQHEEDRGQG